MIEERHYAAITFVICCAAAKVVRSTVVNQRAGGASCVCSAQSVRLPQ
jgi:hypothetical protein